MSEMGELQSTGEEESSHSQRGRMDTRSYSCKICGFTRSRLSRVKDHVLQQHREEALDVNGKNENLQQFIISRSGYKPKSKRAVGVESLNTGSKRVYSARNCSNNSEEEHKSDSSVHSCQSKNLDRISGVIRRYKCKVCGITRAKRSKLKCHVLSKHLNGESCTEVDSALEIVKVDRGYVKQYNVTQDSEESGSSIDRNSCEAGSNSDIRRYHCKLCGIIRSKRALLKNHILSTHGMEVSKDEEDDLIEKENAVSSSYKDTRRYECHICGLTRSKRVLLRHHIKTCHGIEDEVPEAENERAEILCEDCGILFKKPSHLVRHKASHKDKKMFQCTADGCSKSFKRKDSLNSHMLKHEGNPFICPIQHCQLDFSAAFNLKRHLERHHKKGESWRCQRPRPSVNIKVGHICPVPDCGKCFHSPSRLAKHLDDVHSTVYDDIICCETGCLKQFPNVKLLQAHIQDEHSRVCCEVCGSKQLKRQLKRHMQVHENRDTVVERIRCPYERCLHSYTKKFNLSQHIRVVHECDKPFECRFDGCGMTFAYKNVRDNHEKSQKHCYFDGGFEEEDLAFQLRCNGGRKRKIFTLNTILRKRVCCPKDTSVFENGFSYMDWLMLVDEEL